MVRRGASCPHGQQVVDSASGVWGKLSLAPASTVGTGIPRSHLLTPASPLCLASAQEKKPGGCFQQSPLSTASCLGGNACPFPPLLPKQGGRNLELAGERSDRMGPA